MRRNTESNRNRNRNNVNDSRKIQQCSEFWSQYIGWFVHNFSKTSSGNGDDSSSSSTLASLPRSFAQYFFRFCLVFIFHRVLCSFYFLLLRLFVHFCSFLFHFIVIPHTSFSFVFIFYRNKKIHITKCSQYCCSSYTQYQMNRATNEMHTNVSVCA